jgi:hypothetical protein
MFLGRGTQPIVDRGTAQIVCATPSELFNQSMPWREFSPQCRWTLFDVGCGLNKNNFVAPGTVLAGSMASQILSTGLVINALLPGALSAPPTGHFDTGVIRFLSGQNIGLSATVKSFLGAGLASYRGGR